MNILTIKNLSKAFTDKILFDGIDFSLEEGTTILEYVLNANKDAHENYGATVLQTGCLPLNREAG